MIEQLGAWGKGAVVQIALVIGPGYNRSDSGWGRLPVEGAIIETRAE